MKTAPIVPARVGANPDGVPYSAAYDDVYHPACGALAQARHVFLDGNGLPHRWRGRERFVILETGFGLGNNFLATWDAWRRDPQACRQLHYVSIEAHPLRRDDLRRVPRDPALAPLAEKLVRAWPPLTPNLHRLEFDGGRVQLLLALGDVAMWLRELVAHVDACYLDGFAPSKNPQMWQPPLFKAIARLAAPGATAATWTAARAVRDGLAAAGFAVENAPGQGGKRDITLARYAPRHAPHAPPPGRAAPRAAGDALVVGGGLAGCASAWALAQHGWRCTVLDRRATPAAETSGHPAGIFHGIVHAEDGAHARFYRAAALEAQRCVGGAIARDGIAGAVDGLLRLQTSGLDADAMQAVLERLGLPDDYVQAFGPSRAAACAGAPIAHPAWFHPGGGWVRPAELAAALLRTAGEAAQWRGDTTVAAMRRAGNRWQALDADARVIAEADVLVLANAGDALRLLGGASWPVRRVRGQVSSIDAAALPVVPRMPIAGAGYVVPPLQGRVVFGATAQEDDDDAAVRASDHRDNVAQLARLLGVDIDVPVHALEGRTAWRLASADRLPIVGAVPAADAASRTGARLDQPRFVVREPGLYAFTALGSRGIGVCALGAQVLAAAISGAPSPLEASLLDAVDPARFVSRAARHAARRGQVKQV
jgi:tRNA 5-methylaminomethyl-2-thiouridine biosynthesis bifunctional protein